MLAIMWLAKPRLLRKMSLEDIKKNKVLQQIPEEYHIPQNCFIAVLNLIFSIKSIETTIRHH